MEPLVCDMLDQTGYLTGSVPAVEGRTSCLMSRQNEASLQTWNQFQCFRVHSSVNVDSAHFFIKVAKNKHIDFFVLFKVLH